jgi:hypothetical protein
MPGERGGRGAHQAGRGSIYGGVAEHLACPAASGPLPPPAIPPPVSDRGETA